MKKRLKLKKKMEKNLDLILPKGNSNFLKVKDPKRFKKICKEFRLKVIKNEEYYAFKINPNYGFEWNLHNPDNYDSDKYPSAIEILAETIEDDEVLLFYFFYVGDHDFPIAETIAINNKGDKIETNFDEVFANAHCLGNNIEEGQLSLFL